MPSNAGPDPIFEVIDLSDGDEPMDEEERADEKPSPTSPTCEIISTGGRQLRTRQIESPSIEVLAVVEPPRKRHTSSRVSWEDKKYSPTDDSDDEKPKIVARRRCTAKSEKQCAKDMGMEPKSENDAEDKSLKAPRVFLAPFDLDKWTDLTNKRESEEVPNYNLAGGNNEIWDDRLEGQHGGHVCMVITDFIFAMDCERHAFETSPVSDEGEEEVFGKFYPTRPDWLYEQRHADGKSMVVCTGLIQAYLTKDGSIKERSVEDGRRCRITVPIKNSGTVRFILNESVRSFVECRVFSKVKVAAKLDEYHRVEMIADENQMDSDGVKPDYLSMTSDDLHSAARAFGKELMPGSVDFASCEMEIYFYLDGAPATEEEVPGFAHMFERDFRVPSDKMSRLANCDEREFTSDNEKRARDRKFKSPSKSPMEKLEAEFDDIVVLDDDDEEEDYNAEMCDNDVAGVIEWMRRHPAFIRVFLDRCLAEDVVDPFCEQEEDGKQVDKPLDYKFFNRIRIRCLALEIAAKYYIEDDMISLKHLWDLGFRGWHKDVVKFTTQPKKEITKSLTRYTGGAAGRSTTTTISKSDGPSALIFTTPATAMTFSGMMPLALNLLAFGRRNRSVDAPAINGHFDVALFDWAKQTGRYKNGMSCTDIISILLVTDVRPMIETMVLGQEFEGTAESDEYAPLAHLMRCLFDNYYHDYLGFERVDLSSCVVENSLVITPHHTIAFKNLRVCKKTHDDHCMALHIERQLSEAERDTKIESSFYVMPGDVVEMDVKECAMVMGMVTRIDVDEGNVDNSKLHVIPFVPLTSFPITYGISAKHELIIPPSLCDIVRARDVVRVVSNVKIVRENAEAWANGSSYLKMLMTTASERLFIVRSVVDYSGQAVQQIPTRLLRQMRQSFTPAERLALTVAASAESAPLAASAGVKCRIMAGCQQCKREIQQTQYPTALIDGRMQVNDKCYIGVGVCVALSAKYWHREFRKLDVVKDMIQKLTDKGECWLANCLARKFIRRSPWSLTEVSRTIYEMAKAEGDMVEGGRWEKEFCRVVDYRNEFVDCADPKPDEEQDSTVNRIFDDEQPSLDICFVKSIDEKTRTVTVGRFLRVQQTDLLTVEVEGYVLAEKELFVDEENDFTIPFDALPAAVKAMAYIRPVDDARDKKKVADDVVEWLMGGPDRFIARSPIAIRTTELDIKFKPASRKLKKDIVETLDRDWQDSAPGFAEMNKGVKSLPTLDLFAGCGGLSLGLEQSGIMDPSKSFAVEYDPVIASVYKRNHESRGVQMVTGGVGEFLHRCYAKAMGTTEFMPKEMRSDPKNTLASCADHPTRGMIKLIVGGPPCQGYSGLNSSRSGKTSTEKRQHIISFLSAVEFFRPNYCIMENVRGLAGSSHDGISALGQCVDALLAMGMQVRVQCLQANAYGVPQNRVRIFIVGAAPGMDLAAAPIPSHSVTVNLAEYLTVGASDRPFCLPSPSVTDRRPLVEHLEHKDPACTSGVDYRVYTICDAHTDTDGVIALDATSAMHPPLNIQAAISDLATPAIELDFCAKWTPTTSKIKIPVERAPPKSFYQMQQRDGVTHITSHQSKDLGDLEDARILLIPNDQILPDGDWRLLPNRVVEYGQGDDVLITDTLDYTFYANEFGERLPARGMCPCGDVEHPATKRETAAKRLRKDNSRAMELCRRFKKNVQSVIPYCMTHTAESKNQWSGQYGRSYRRLPFQTIITTLQPTGKQGRVLHYRHNRTFTGRELARGQAFPDSFIVDDGNFSDMVRVIGNAVPPPLSRAIGLQMIKAMNAKDPRDVNFDDPPM